LTRIIDGKVVAESIYKSVKTRLWEYYKRTNRKPTLAVILANTNPASATYISKKIKACEEVEMWCQVHDWTKRDKFSTATPEEYARFLLGHLQQRQANGYNFFDGLIVQLPVEDCADPRPLYRLVDPLKDVDCFHPENVGLVLQGSPRFLPCTPAGIIELLKHSSIDLAGKRVAVINNSDIVGKPLAMLLTQEHATVTVCHKYSDPEHVKEICKTSDVVVVAVGKPHFLTKEYVHSKSVVIDVGISRVDGKIVGDVHPEVYRIVQAYSPVPGGIGVMTVAMLVQNVMTAAELQVGICPYYR
jgi:methylenetetrahydrofolate dehydrogenase (NADP+)/methenyltetrahydrofolate cyclohydrolase